jgi:hypothetical protein
LATGNFTGSNTEGTSWKSSTEKSYWEQSPAIGGGGSTSTSQLKGLSGQNSQNIAAYFNSDKVIVCHGGTKKSLPGVVGLRTYNTLYKAFLFAGRAAGVEPQVPITLKKIDIDGEVHRLTDDEQEFCLTNGICYSYYDFELSSFVVGQGITSLLNNVNLINNDATSFSLAVLRIKSQLNKEIILEAKKTFYGSESGPNRNTISKESLSSWLDGFLKKKVASTNNDDLITGYGNLRMATLY